MTTINSKIDRNDTAGMQAFKTWAHDLKYGNDYALESASDFLHGEGEAAKAEFISLVARFKLGLIAVDCVRCDASGADVEFFVERVMA